MREIQLEMNIENLNPQDFRMQEMQRQIDVMSESVGKVRRKLFAELGEMKKLYSSLQAENEDLKTQLRNLNGQKAKWNYSNNGKLFELDSEAFG